MKKFLAIFVTCALIFTTLPMNMALAADDYGNTPTSATNIILSTTETSINGTLEIQGDYDFFKFTAPVDGIYKITTGSADKLGMLYGSDGATVLYQESADGKIHMNVALYEGTTYYLRVRGDVGAYTLVIIKPDDYGDSWSEARSLGYLSFDSTTDSIDGTLDYYMQNTGDYDYFGFTVPFDALYTIETQGNVATRGTLFESDGITRVTSEMDGNGDGFNFRITHQLYKNVKYYIRVRATDISGATKTGAYSLVISKSLPVDDFGDDYLSAHDIGTIPTLKTTIDGNMESPSDIDFFKFTPTYSTRYVIGTTGSLYTQGTLYVADETEPSGLSEIVSSKSHNSDPNFRLGKTLEAGVTYYLSVQGVDIEDLGNTGEYNLFVQQLDPGDTLSIAYDYGDYNQYAPIDSIETIDPATDVDCYCFWPNVTGTHTIETVGSDTTAILYDSNKNPISSEESSITQQLTVNMPYYIQVRSTSGTTGFYHLLINTDDGNDIATATDLGSLSATSTKNRDGSIYSAGDVDFFKFNVPENATYSIASTGDANAVFQLLKSDGTPFDSDPESSSISKPLVANTTYYIRVRGDSTGSYNIEFNLVPPEDDYGNTPASASDLGTISSYTTISGNIEAIGDYDYFKFTPSASGFYAINTWGESDSIIQLYLSNGSTPFNSDPESYNITQPLTANTVYYIRVRSKRNITGAYQLIISQDDYGNTFDTAADLGTLPSDAITSRGGTITNSNDYDCFKFIAPVSGTYMINMHTIYERAQLYGSDGSTIGSESNNIIQSLTANTTYYLRVRRDIHESFLFVISPPDIAETYFVNNFDDLPTQQLHSWSGGWGLPSPYDYLYNDRSGSNCAITQDPGPNRDGNALMVSGNDLRVYRWLDDIPYSDKFTYQFDARFTNVNQDFWFGFSQEGFVNLSPTCSGQIVGTEGFKGKIQSNTWVKIGIEVDRVSNTYNIYLNDVKAIANQPIPNPSNIQWNCFTISGHNVDPVYIDNIKAYKGNYFGEAPAPTEQAGSVWFENKFDDLTPQTIPANPGFWQQPAPYDWFYNDCVSANTDVSIVSDADWNSNVLRLLKKGTAPQNESFKVFRYTYDNTAPEHAINNPDLQGFAYEMDFKITNFTQNWLLGFNDFDFVSFPNTPNGTITIGNPGFQINQNQWYHLKIYVNKQTNKYNVYIDNNLVFNDRNTPFNVKDTDINQFTIKSNYNYYPNGTGYDSSLYLDNLKGYPCN